MTVTKWRYDTGQPLLAPRVYQEGGAFAGFVQLRGWRMLGLQLELGYANRGTEAVMDGESLGEHSLDYLDLSVLGRAELPFHAVTLYVIAGPVGSYLVRAQVKNAFGVPADVTDQFERFDWSGRAGLGLGVGPFSWGLLFLEARYDLGFNDLAADPDVTIHNRTISLLLGYEYRGQADRDGDGVRDKDDRCPDEAEDKDDFEDADGCPDPDNDADGFLDAKDQCPLEKGVAPDGCPDRDSDDDGIPNADDKCPKYPENPEDATQDGCPDKDDDGVWDHLEGEGCVDQPEDKDAFEDDDGCPDLDNDNDSILDADDQCPLEPEDIDKHQDKDGCPDPDNDGDGVLDANDGDGGVCKDQPETKNGWKDQDGCKDSVPRSVARLRGVLAGLKFAAKQTADIQAHALDVGKSSRKLARVASTMADNPHFALLVVAYSPSQDISQANAEAVQTDLVGRGIQADRLSIRACVVPETGPRAQRRTRIELALVGDPANPDDLCATPISSRPGK